MPSLKAILGLDSSSDSDSDVRPAAEDVIAKNSILKDMNCIKRTLSGPRSGASKVAAIDEECEDENANKKLRLSNEGKEEKDKGATEAPTSSSSSSTGFFSWRSALVAIADKPSEAKGVIKIDESIIAIKDAYPKAKYHYLLVARDKDLDNITQVTSMASSFDIEGMGSLVTCVIMSFNRTASY